MRNFRVGIVGPWSEGILNRMACSVKNVNRTSNVVSVYSCRLVCFGRIAEFRNLDSRMVYFLKFKIRRQVSNLKIKLLFLTCRDVPYVLGNFPNSFECFENHSGDLIHARIIQFVQSKISQPVHLYAGDFIKSVAWPWIGNVLPCMALSEKRVNTKNSLA